MSIPHTIQPEYDLIFAGGGTAACIAATRLAETFPERTILVLECGPTTKDKKEHIQPGMYMSHLAPGSKTTVLHVAPPSEDVGGRAVGVPIGRCVGGSSSINFMVYNRPAASDLDEWEKTFGNEGWNAEKLIPLFQKSETYELGPDMPTHGSNGPLKVSYGGGPGGSGLGVWKEFVDVGSQIEVDRPAAHEGNGFYEGSVNVFFRTPKWISSEGRRSDVAHHYLYNKNLPNLTVCDGCIVNRIVIKDGVATGVEYLFNNQVHDSAPQTILTAKARELVIVSGGTMGSPLILERSGIGRKDILQRADIPLVVDLPGVGEGYQDHILLCPLYLIDSREKTMDALFRGEPATLKAAQEQWEADGSGLMSTNGVEGGLKLRPRLNELPELGPEFMEYWDTEGFADKPDKPVLSVGPLAMGLNSSDPSLASLKAVSIATFLCYPISRGHFHISSSNPCATPDFKSGFLSSPGEVAALRWGYKKGREIARRLPSFRGSFEPAHPKYPQGSAARETETQPVPLGAPKMEYSKEDDAAIDEFLRGAVQTAWHSLGTCAMKPRDQGGVVDNKLNVYGVKNLKVADLSIAPGNVNCNTYSCAIAIGEKAAVVFAEELGGVCV
ncbi:hypothetical protein FB45DRAFT_927948 [Roridomyces roridus]|uniref:Glucose-methanol-choline oxidoreductase N-terminal domain-containing protein n=1 Tax=Roridomyces roridus TaxID=1738132 RepID=A0AAD7FFA5_9AGAR|nr:hypothetical protein FB45DRAFT_927948 [Roridomyces roridus]